MPAPLIGISTGIQRDEEGFARLVLNEVYSRSVLRAGGIPVQVPTGLGLAQVDELRGRLDGLVITGGPDINPELYGGEPHPNVYGVDPNRDEMDMALIRDAINRRVPVLGICRGHQMLNVTMGGTLYTDLVDQHPHSLKHDCHPEHPREYEAHFVTIEPDSKLSRILGCTRANVNSMHHQGVKTVGKGLRAVAYAPDHLVESVELPDHPFALGVQWHPECMQDVDMMQALFRALVSAAQK